MQVLSKLGVEGIISTSVVLRVHKNPIEEKHSHTTKKDSQIAECTVVLKGGAVVHTSERSEDMYASIDLVSHKLAQKLRRHKDKVQSKRKNEKVCRTYAVFYKNHTSSTTKCPLISYMYRSPILSNR